jgi:hypothetical protein
MSVCRVVYVCQLCLSVKYSCILKYVCLSTAVYRLSLSVYSRLRCTFAPCMCVCPICLSVGYAVCRSVGYGYAVLRSMSFVSRVSVSILSLFVQYICLSNTVFLYDVCIYIQISIIRKADYISGQ